MKRVKVQYPASNENNWARGCDKCSFGVQSAPPLTRVGPLYLERIAQHLDKSITYCDCKAGVRYKSALGNRYRELVEAHNRKSHPDIDAVRAAMHNAYDNAPPPTVHGAERAEEAERVAA